MTYIHKAIILDEAIFIVVPKVANTSVKVALANWTNRSFKIGPNGPLVHSPSLFQYDSVQNLHQYQQPKIGFVRDPWSRLVSCYRNKIEGNGSMQLGKWGMKKHMPFVDFVAAIEKHWGSFNSHWAPCAKWAIYADKVIKFEHLSEEWNILQEQFNLPALPHNNNTGATTVWKSYYTDELIAKVREMYNIDVQNWYANW